jgi:hypothetical protein
MGHENIFLHNDSPGVALLTDCGENTPGISTGISHIPISYIIITDPVVYAPGNEKTKYHYQRYHAFCHCYLVAANIA